MGGSERLEPEVEERALKKCHLPAYMDQLRIIGYQN